MPLRRATLRDLAIDDEDSFRHVALYDDLKRILVRDAYPFRIAEENTPSANWNRVLLLNLTFWSPEEPADVLVDARIPADVVIHVAWHHLARAALSPTAPPSADAMFFGEAIASASDLYLVGRLLGHAPESEFLQTQVSAMAEVCEQAGLGDVEFETLLDEVAGDPERAFEDLRQLLFDATSSLVRARDVDDAEQRLARFDDHRFGSLLHHYELSNWVLYARAYAPSRLDEDPTVRALDATLRREKVSLDWLEREWVRPRLP